MLNQQRLITMFAAYLFGLYFFAVMNLLTVSNVLNIIGQALNLFHFLTHLFGYLFSSTCSSCRDPVVCLFANLLFLMYAICIFSFAISLLFVPEIVKFSLESPTRLSFCFVTPQ